MAPLLEIKNLHVEYKTGRSTANALNGINLTIEKGKLWAWWERPEPERQRLHYPH